MERIEFIISEFQKCNIKLSQDKADKLLKLYEFLVEYNKNVNLTAITDFEEVVVKHFIDSVLPFSMIDIKENSSFIDVGTGAGFPSIPLMIVRPDLKGTLLEALNKRCVFLEKACELTEVDAKVIHGRAEDYATARAVAAMPVLCEYCIPYVKTGGRFIALKSVNEDETLCEKAVKVLGGKIAEIKDYTITNGDNRRLFIIDKVSQTPTKYPRNPSMIKKKPL